MRELVMTATMRTVVSKLPYKLIEKWRTSACNIQEQCKRRAQFTDSVTLIEHHVKTVSDPVFGHKVCHSEQKCWQDETTIKVKV